MAKNKGLGSDVPGKPTPTMDDFNVMRSLLIGVAVVCALGFLTLLISYFTYTHAAFLALRDEVNRQNLLIDNLSSQIVRTYSVEEIKMHCPVDRM